MKGSSRQSFALIGPPNTTAASCSSNVGGSGSPQPTRLRSIS
jgi:hypothetical protein